MDQLLAAVKDALHQFDLSDEMLNDDFTDAMERLQIEYDRVTSEPNHAQVPA